jgi:hypothetical protein
VKERISKMHLFVTQAGEGFKRAIRQASMTYRNSSWLDFKRQVLLIACNGKNAYESFANQLRDWKPLTKRTPGCESSLLISLLQIWEATRLFQTETESISEHELVNIFMRKLGDVGSTRFFRSEMHRNSGTMTVERLLQVIELNNNIEDSTNSLASSIHFPDSHKYSQMEAPPLPPSSAYKGSKLNQRML